MNYPHEIARRVAENPPLLVVSVLRLLHFKPGLDLMEIIVFYVLIAAPLFFTLTDARFPMQLSEKPRVSNQVKIDQLSEANADLEYGASSPLSLPPLESLPPLSLPGSAPPFCINPPFGPPSPSTTLPSPVGHTPPASPPPFAPVLPIQNPPPSPPHNFASPPARPPTPKSPPYVPSPPKCIPSPSGYQPPMVYPPPTVPPPPHKNAQNAVWCVAKRAVPDSIIQEALDYACGSGAECKPIQPNGHCFQPNTLVAHASYAFNSYWQKTKAHGGTCDFGGTAMLVTIDPSYDDCSFNN